MPMFVSDERIPVSDDQGNTIYIRSKMTLGARAKMQDIVLSASTKSNDVEVRLGHVNLSLLVSNIVGWDGPEFDGVPCTEANIRRLDPDEPLLDAVLAEINTRNVKAESPDPN